MFETPGDLRYLESHEWYRESDGRVGISDFAQDELGDVVFVELPAEGDELVAGESFGVVESIKAVSDVYAPVTGTVVDVNDELADHPEHVNEDPYGDGWLLAVEPEDATAADDLLDAEAYAAQVE